MQLIHDVRPELLDRLQEALGEDGYDEVLSQMREVAEDALAAEELSAKWAEISLTLVGREEIHALNCDYRGMDRETDVLSFPQYETLAEVRTALAQGSATTDREAQASAVVPLGDVVLCLEVALSQAEEYGHSAERELVYLFLHSVLHLLGYDHMTEEDRRVMRAREKAILGERV